MRTLLLLAVATLALAACGGGSESRSGTAPTQTVATALERARELIRGCRVQSTVSLHSGAYYLVLKDGTELELPPSSEPEITRAIQRATPRCGPVPIAME